MNRLRLVLQLLTEREKQIFSFLTRHKAKSAFEISIELKVTQSTVYKALNRLAREGLVKTEKVEGSDVWSAVTQKEFRDIFVRAVDGLINEIYK